MIRQSSISFIGLDEETPFNQELCGKYITSFAYVTIKDRLPVILTKVIDQLARDKEEIVATYGASADESIKTAIGAISKLKNEVQTNKALVELDSNESDSVIWNKYLEEMEKVTENVSWYLAPWLYTETYMYRRLQQVFETSISLKGFDPFRKQKKEALAAAECRLGTIVAALQTANTSNRALFNMAIKLSLWSNRCDLSLSNGIVDSENDSVLANVNALSKYLLVDETENAFDVVSKEPSQIIDIVHDNAAYELFADLCMASELLGSGLANKIRLRVKKFPWYVSDVTKNDISWLLDQLPRIGMEDLATKWKEHISSGRFEIFADQFWTLPFPYKEMKSRDPALYSSLAEASLVIFKGDLNYRKLVGDINWNYSTRFSDALQGFEPSNLLALRTIKADLVCGLPDGVAQQLSKQDPLWMRTGQYALIQFKSRVATQNR